MILDFVIMGMCFISLYLAIFWISLFYIEHDSLSRKQKLSNLPSLSILVPAYNEEKTISETLKSLLSLDYPKNKLEVMVIDDGSTDRTAEIVRKFKRVRLLHKENGGKGSALNFGIKQAKGELIGVVDADSIAARNAVKLMLPYLDDEKTAAVISGLRVYKPGNLLQKLQHLEYMLVAFVRRLMAKIDTLYITPGVLSLYKKEVLQKVGGFATNTLTEDLEMGMRLRSHGYSIKSQINAVTRTTVPDNLKAFYRQRLRWRRGFFENMYAYKYMLFNKKYDLMGMFQLPVVLLGPLMVFILVAMIGNEIAHSWQGFFIAWDVLKWKAIHILPEPYSLKTFLLNIKTVRFFTIPLFFSTIFLFSRAQKELKAQWKYPLTWLVYFILYIPFSASFWFIATFYEVFGIKKRW